MKCSEKKIDDYNPLRNKDSFWKLGGVVQNINLKKVIAIKTMKNNKTKVRYPKRYNIHVLHRFNKCKFASLYNDCFTWYTFFL